MTGAEALMRTLVEHGVDVCFMNPGTSEMQFVSALDRVEEMRGVLCLHETVCAGAADGYARMLHRPAAALLHLGPGLANGLSNFHNARKARSAVVNIVGEHSSTHLAYDAPLSADVAAFARTVSRWVEVAASPETIGGQTAAAVAASYGPPGQVATLIVPADVSWSGPAETAAKVAPMPPRAVEGGTIAQAAEWLKSGSRCGLLLSGPALERRGLEAAARIEAGCGARVFANRYAGRLTRGRGVFAPLRLPYFPEPAEKALEGIERLVLVETAAPVTFFGYPGRRSTLAPLGCDMMFLSTEAEDSVSALEEVADLVGAEPVHTAASEEPVEAPREGPLNLDTIGQALAAVLPEASIVSDEMISAGESVNGWLSRAAWHDLLPVTGGSIGQGLPVAVGAAIACPDRKVVALEADGSGMYSLQALWTMARERLDVVVIVFANRRYKILDIEMERTGSGAAGPRAGRMLDLSDPALAWVALARGQGVEAAKAETLPEFTAILASALGRRGPFLIEAQLAERG